MPVRLRVARAVQSERTESSVHFKSVQFSSYLSLCTCTLLWNSPTVSHCHSGLLLGRALRVGWQNDHLWSALAHDHSHGSTHSRSTGASGVDWIRPRSLHISSPDARCVDNNASIIK